MVTMKNTSLKIKHFLSAKNNKPVVTTVVGNPI